MIRVPINAFLRFQEKSGWIMASHVAMSMMLALFPFILFIVALTGQFASNIDVDELIQLTMGGWPEAVSKPLAQELHAVANNDPTRLLSIGGVLTLLFASNGVNAIRVAMTAAYHEEDTRPFWLHRLICLAFVLAGAVLVMVLAFLAVALPLYFNFVNVSLPKVYDLVFDSRIMRILVGGVIAYLAVTACHAWLTGPFTHPIKVWPGVVLTVLVWELAATGFSIYVADFASYSATYAGLAGAMSALIFLYLMAMILIFGAAFNAALGDWLYSADPVEPRPEYDSQ
ncbi:MAG: YihY/virulence factor BrkB family protein [Pseudomonadota bacterium]